MSVIIWKRFHNWNGMASGIFLVVLLATGVLLNHPGLLQKNPEQAIGLSSHSGAVYSGRKDGLYRSMDGGKSWDEVEMLYPPQDVADICSIPPNRIYVLEKWGSILKSADGGAVWQTIRLPFDAQSQGVELRKIAASSDDRLAVLTSHGLLLSTDGGRTWDLSHFNLKSTPVYRLVKVLHNGYFFGPKFVWVYDASALALLFLIISGVVLWNSNRSKTI